MANLAIAAWVKFWLNSKLTAGFITLICLIGKIIVTLTANKNSILGVLKWLPMHVKWGVFLAQPDKTPDVQLQQTSVKVKPTTS